MDTMETLSDPALQDSQFTYEQEEALRNQANAAKDALDVDVGEQETQAMEGEGGEEEAPTSDEEIEPVPWTHDQNEEMYVAQEPTGSATQTLDSERPNLKRLQVQVIDSDDETRTKQAKLESKGVHKDREPLGPLPNDDQSMEAVLAESEKKLEGANILEAQKKLRASIRNEAQEEDEDDQKGQKEDASEEEETAGKGGRGRSRGKGRGRGKRKKDSAKDEKSQEKTERVEQEPVEAKKNKVENHKLQ